MDMLKILKEDHEYVLHLFDELDLYIGIERGDQVTHQLNLFIQLRQSLETHMAGEERFFYPPLKEDRLIHSMAIDVMEEHHGIKLFLAEMTAGPINRRWNEQFAVLRKNTEKHFAGEEEKLFSSAEYIFSVAQREKLSREIVAAEEEKIMEYAWKQAHNQGGA